MRTVLAVWLAAACGLALTMALAVACGGGDSTAGPSDAQAANDAAPDAPLDVSAMDALTDSSTVDATQDVSLDSETPDAADAGPCRPIALRPRVDFATASGPSSVAWGDFNGDGKPDLAVANFFATNVSVFLNTTPTGSTSPTFAARSDFASGFGPAAIAIGDINGDGKPDLVAANSSEATVAVLLNTTAAGSLVVTFASKFIFATGSGPSGVTVADINADGKVDLAVANRGSSSISVFINTTAQGAANASFVAKVDFVSGNAPSAVIAADVNGDGRPDLASIAQTVVSVFLNTTSGVTPSFAARVDLTSGFGSFAVAPLDIDGDGKPDLAVTNQSTSTVSLFRNTTASGATTPSFAPKVDLATSPTPQSIAAGDLDGDGKPDLALATYNSGALSVACNATPRPDATPAFAPAVDIASGAGAIGVALGDVNADGRFDIAVANQTANTISVFVSR
jgi:hypothetical protein